ncbi:MAG: LacI family DNA-binding transcriptional regulator [Planctomycetota bacterium]
MSLTILNQIAAEIGVSRWTVSRVLRGEATYVQRAASERAQLIRDRAAELGYRPNAAAQAIGRGRFDTLALLSSAEESEYVSLPLLFGLLNEAQRCRQHVVCERLPDGMLGATFGATPQLPRLLERTSCDVVLFHGIGTTPATLTEFAATSSMPFVWVNARRKHDSVYLDDKRGGAEVTRALLQAGHRRIALVTSSAERIHSSARERQKGYESEMRKAGLATNVVRLDEPQLFGHDPSPAETLGPLLNRRDRPTAVLGVDQAMAAMVLVQAYRQGLRVPADLSVAGFGSSISNQTGVRMALGLTPDSEMGRAAVTMALEKVKAPDVPVPAVRLRLRFEPLDTIAPPPK